MRCFISVDIPDSVKKEILKIQEGLPKFDGKLTEYENLHLTLKFLGEIDEEKIEEIERRLGGIKFPKIKVSIDSIGFFDNSTSRIYERRIIIWLHMTNCERLQKEIDYVLKRIFPEEKRFMSHLTIARVKSLKNKEEFLSNLEKIQVSKIKFEVKEFYLKESVLTDKRPIYKTLEYYPLI